LRENFYEGDRLSIPIIGEEADVLNIGYDDLRSFYESQYITGNLIVVAASAVNHEDLARQVEVAFVDLPRGEFQAQSPKMNKKLQDVLIQRDWDHVDHSLGFEIPDETQGRSVQYSILSEILNDHVSRLLREEKNIVYAAGAFTSYFPKVGHLVIQTSLTPANSEIVADCFCEAIKTFIENISQEEIDNFLAQQEELLADLETNIQYIGENLAETLQKTGDYIPLDAKLKAAQSMTPDDLKQMMLTALGSNHYFAAVGACEELPDMTQRLAALRQDLGISERRPSELGPAFEQIKGSKNDPNSFDAS